MKWADLFCAEAQAAGLEFRVINRVNGWPETTVVEGKRCYTKSITYQINRGLYFQGVDPKKLNQSGDYVLLCGGMSNRLRDIFLIPWENFFQAIRFGEAVNTYKPPKQYWQYKFKVRHTDGRWLLTVQGGEKPEIDVTRWRFDVEAAIKRLNME